VIHPRKRPLAATAAAAAIVVAAAACSSSSSSGGSTTSAGAKKTVTVGVLTDLTGPAASGDKNFVDGVKAGVVYAARNGVNVKYVVADAATNPTTVLSAAQKLVEQDGVNVVAAESPLTMLAAQWLTAHRVPVVGISEDGPEWATSSNMFSVSGALQPTQVTTTYGKFFKDQGVTSVAALGYGISPISAEEAENAAASAKAAGLKVGYLDAKYPYGSTDVGPSVLKIKTSGADGFTATFDPNIAFAMIKALKDQGANIKVPYLPTGYGGDLADQGTGAMAAAQGVYFSLGYEPAEMQTAATKQFVADLASAGITRAPGFSAYNGYASIALLVEGLQKSNGATSSSALIAGLSAIHDFNAAGLYGDLKLDVNDRSGLKTLSCIYVTKYDGKTFALVKGADPVCGTAIPGNTVSPST
jgi:ABC-type branched-subunit amino acid transport system substrate-binding protein